MVEAQQAELVLTCDSWQEAQTVVDHLLAAELALKAEMLQAAEKVQVVAQVLAADVNRVIQAIERLTGKVPFPTDSR